MAVSLQITLGSGATQIDAKAIYCRQILVQNNSAAVCRLGDSTVSATKGIQLFAGGGSFNAGAVSLFADVLSAYWLFGTEGDVIDVLYLAD